VERRKVSMSKLEILVNVLVLVVTLAACGAVGVEPAAAAEPVIEVESAMGPRARDVDFLRHNCGANPRAAKAVVDTRAKATFERRPRDVDFLRHNYGANPRAAKAVVDTRTEATSERRARGVDFLRHNCGANPRAAEAVVDTKAEARFERRARDVDFLRHNYGTNPWDAKVDAGKPLQTLDCRPNKR
jgi:hypothetical protein